MVNRLDLLHMQIGGPELQAVTKLLDALHKDMCTEVQQKLSDRFAHTDDYGLPVVPVTLRKRLSGMPRSCLCTLGSPQGLGGVTTMLRVNPAVLLQPVATRGLVISVARWAMSRGHALI
jgi:hypothetical protein